MKPFFNQIDVVILCGGIGSRLKTVVSDRPKALAAFGDTTFLDILINSLKRNGFKRFILCVGYMKDKIKDHFKDREDITIQFSEEDEPLGTGGALKNAKLLIQSETFIVMNGDSICDINYQNFFNFHENKDTILSLALVQTKETKDFGSVVMNESNEITSFKEKATTDNLCLINAGIYLMQKDIFSHIPDRSSFSLELDFFPKIIREVRCSGFILNSELIDIGTPERYKLAIHLIGERK
jgi:NDP-sugar pyrophosphorylase family protein